MTKSYAGGNFLLSLLLLDVVLGRTLALDDGGDDTNSDGLAHITDGETAERGEFLEGLDAHHLLWHHGGIDGVVLLGKGWILGQGVTLLLGVKFDELACNVCGVAVKHWGVTGHDLTRVVGNDDGGTEILGVLGWIVLVVGSDETTFDVLDGNVLDVESNVVTWNSLLHDFVVHLDGLALSDDADWGEAHVDSGLEDTSLDTSNWDGTDTRNLVDILEWETKWLVGWAVWCLDLVKCLEKAWTLVPWHVRRHFHHVVTLETRAGDKWDLLWFETNLLEATDQIRFNFLVTSLVVLDGLGVHLVHKDNHLLDTKSKGEECVLASLAILGEGGLKTTLVSWDNKNSNISLGGTSDHVLDEITVTGGIDNGEVVFLGGEFPQSNINGDTTLTLGFQVIKNPSVLERGLAHLGSLLLELLDSSLIDTSALVDQVTSGGGFSGINVTDNNQRDMDLFLGHDD